jgi:endonuclease YncB( thermonuclease family)
MKHLTKMILLVILLAPIVTLADDLSGHIVGVSDGDTVTLLDQSRQQHKIRLSGIDAPESHQPFGQKSKTNLAAMVFNREVIAECGKIDKYRRQVCVDGADVNLEQVKAGMAWWYRIYAKEQTAQQRTDYEAAEDAARSSRIGLWRDANPVAPWEFRRR